MRRAVAVMLALLSLALPAGCADGTADDPYDASMTVGLADGRIVDCVKDTGLICDWAHPRRPKAGEHANRQARYYQLDGRVIPCATRAGGSVNAVTCDFTREGESL